jgi:DNA-binding beta-propeller fold protein YncE
VACSGNGNVVVLNATTLSSTPVATISTGPVSNNPEQLAIRPDGQRVYVTIPITNQMFVIDSSVSPPVQLAVAFPATNPLTLQTANGNEPFSIAVVANGGDFYAYISKQAGSTSSDGVDIVNGLATDNFGNFSTVNTGTSPTLAVPSFVAATPDNSHVYVSLNSTGAVAVIANTSTPAQITGSPFALVSGANPTGITIPIVSSGTVRAYIAQSGKSNAAIYDDASTPAADGASPITLGPTTSFSGMASIPPPQ